MDGFGLSGLVGVEEFFGLLFVLFEVGAVG
jgi:hypothetical protein